MKFRKYLWITKVDLDYLCIACDPLIPLEASVSTICWCSTVSEWRASRLSSSNTLGLCTLCSGDIPRCLLRVTPEELGPGTKTGGTRGRERASSDERLAEEESEGHGEAPVFNNSHEREDGEGLGEMSVFNNSVHSTVSGTWIIRPEYHTYIYEEFWTYHYLPLQNQRHHLLLEL